MKLSIFPVLSQDQGCSASGPVSSSARESSNCTTTTSTSTTTNSDNNNNSNFSANSSVSDNIIHQRVLFKEGLNKTADERIDIFRKTQAQSECSLWFEERRGRITGSVCGRIINRNCNIYPKSIIENVLKISRNKTAAMVMGQEQEDRILARYINHKRENGHSDISVEKAGFHQCQLQLYVGRDMFEFCDFVVATERHLFIERITLDRDWVSTNIQQLECFYVSFILPRLVK